ASFPHIALSGCYFHLRQSVHRQITPLDYQTQYQNDPIFAHNIHKFVALAFIHPNGVINASERLSLSLGDDYEDIIDYFEETYIGRLRPNQTRRQPKFSIDFWNM
ncbi:unnamed protein product, partial [Didymodactylos carnosus]